MSAIKVDEILHTRISDKRKSVEVDENFAPGQKLARLDISVDAEGSEAQSSVADIAESEMEPVNETSVRKMIQNFEKRMVKNHELRVKFSDQPEKFMESEIELNVAVQEMHALATVPNLYHLLTESGTVTNLIQLLSHENSDITIAVVDLLQELTDVDTLNESEEGANTLIDALLEGQIVGLLVQNIERLNESIKEESDGIHNSLAVIENISEFKSEVSVTCVEQGLLTWLLKKIKVKGNFDGNKLYASEIVGILLQNSDEAKNALGEQGGVDILLQQLANYKRHNPSSVDEVEYMENLFNALCAALLNSANRARFLRGEGLQLMNLMLREKKMSRASALKILSYATNGKDGRDNCDKFVDILGLRTLFPLFMKTPNKNKRKGHSGEEHEEHSCSVIASLLKNCGAAQRQRVIVKFVEDDYAKVDRLVELHFKYADRVARFERTIMDQNKSSEAYDEDELYLQKLDAGLFTLQLVDYVLADVVVNGSSGIRERALKLFSMRNSTLKSVKTVLREYADNLGGSEAKDDRLVQLVDSL